MNIKITHTLSNKGILFGRLHADIYLGYVTVLGKGVNPNLLSPPHVLTLKYVFFCSGKLIMLYNVCF